MLKGLLVVAALIALAIAALSFVKAEELAGPLPPPLAASVCEPLVMPGGAVAIKCCARRADGSRVCLLLPPRPPAPAQETERQGAKGTQEAGRREAPTGTQEAGRRNAPTGTQEAGRRNAPTGTWKA